MRHRLATLRPEIGREAWTLYGGLFLVVLFGYGASMQLVFGDTLVPDLGLWFVTGFMFGVLPAVLSVLFLAIHRYAYPRDR